jgi:hypothetical protein
MCMMTPSSYESDVFRTSPTCVADRHTLPIQRTRKKEGVREGRGRGGEREDDQSRIEAIDKGVFRLCEPLKVIVTDG